MPLTSTQKTTLKNAIAANTDTIPAGQPWSGVYAGTQVKNVPNEADGNTAIAGYYNLAASPNWTVWRKSVTVTEVGDRINGAELAGLTTANQTRLQTVAMYSAGGINPSLADRRAFFDDIFSGAGGTITRPALLALWKRLATRVQKLFSTGTGSDASPATTDSNVGDTFGLSATDVQEARDS